MKLITKTIVILVGCCALNVHADATLTFKITAPDMQSGVKKISLARFFARIDDPADPKSYLLYQTGKFFPLFAVDQSAETYTRLTPEVNPTLHAGVKKTEPTPKVKSTDQMAKDHESHNHTTSSETNKKAKVISPKTSLKPTKKQQKVAGIECRIIEELHDNQPVMRHCMADKSRLGMTEREVRSLARVFEMARERGYKWLGTATEDEKFVSIRGRDLKSNMTLELVSISTKPLAEGYLRIPKNYRRVDANVLDK